MIFNTIIAIIIGYLLGSIPSAYIAGRLKKGIDIRQVGSGNVGALNVMHQVGTAVGYAAFIADVAKGLLAVFVARWLDLSLIWVLITGFAAVAGHNWPVFLGFKGGKGGGTVMGVFLALVPLEFGITFAIIGLVIIITSNPALGLFIGLAFLPLVIWQLNGSGMLVIYSLALSVFVGIRYLLAGLKRAKSGADIKKGLIFNREYRFLQARKNEAKRQ